MNKKYLILLVGSFFISSNTVSAAEESTISGGYAQSDFKFSGNKIKGHPKGYNFKYRYEINDSWGVISSFVYTHQGYNIFSNGKKIRTADLDYFSLTAGPSYRFNEYVSAYGLIGIGHERGKMPEYVYSSHGNKTSAAYGVGLQFNPIPNIAIDASYEYSKIGDGDIKTWMLGAGYRF